MRERRTLVLTKVLAVAAVVVLVTRLAWVCDDALITLRTALNLTHGWGPGFNATEAVQAYTHPLWFLLWSAVGALSSQWVLGILAVSIVLTGVATAIVVWHATTLSRLVVATAFLAFSNAFVEYATSGLESPLAYALIAVLMVMTLSPRAMGDIGPGTLRARAPWAVATGLVMAAVVLTRFDLVLLIVPVAVMLVVVHRRQWQVLVVGALAALVPLGVWFAWSWTTYHTLLPNTFLAKRNVGIPASELVVQGVRYLWVSLSHDPVTAVALAVGLGVAFAIGTLVMRMWAVGVLLYLTYVVWIGGDFMAGRFLAVAVLVAVFLFVVAGRATGAEGTVSALPAVADARLAAALGLVVLLVGAAAVAGMPPVALTDPQAPRWEVDQNLNAGVTDERGFWVERGMSLGAYMNRLSLAFVTPAIAGLGDGSGLGRELREIDRTAHEWPRADGTFALPSEVGAFCGGLGYLGIATGPTVHLVDQCALTDRFLAEQPYVPSGPFAWKPGHFDRPLPEGYVTAIETGDPANVVDWATAYDLERLWSQIRPPR